MKMHKIDREQWLRDDLAHARGLYRKYAFWVDHILANDGLHDPGVCEACDLIRVRPARAFMSAMDARLYRDELAAPVKKQ